MQAVLDTHLPVPPVLLHLPGRGSLENQVWLEMMWQLYEHKAAVILASQAHSTIPLVENHTPFHKTRCPWTGLPHSIPPTLLLIFVHRAVMETMLPEERSTKRVQHCQSDFS